MRPSSPAASQDASGLDDRVIPPFQWTKELSASVDSRGNDFEFPNVEATTPYRHHLGRVSMRATDWTYYRAQNEVTPIEYHPDWTDELQELGPIRLPAGSKASFNQKRIPPRANSATRDCGHKATKVMGESSGTAFCYLSNLQTAGV